MRKLLTLSFLIFIAFVAWGQAPNIEDYIGWYILNYYTINIATNIEEARIAPNPNPRIMQINETCIIHYYNDGIVYQYTLISPIEVRNRELNDLEVFKGFYE